MSLVFEGSIDNISKRQLAFIRKVLEKRGYNNTKVTIDPVGITGDNYIANVTRIIVSDDNRIFKMIAKIASQSEIVRRLTNMQMLFKNEHYMYTEILPKFHELEVKANVPAEDRLRYAACYGSLSEPPNEVILLEDLQTSDFVVLDRLKSLSDESVKSILKNFAKLHSLSFALKSIEPETFRIMKNNLFDMWAALALIPETLALFSQQEKDVEVILEGDERKQVFRGAVCDSMALAKELSKSEFDNKHSVIQQGDAWINNVMFQFDGDQLEQSVMIDYQVSKESNPVRDIQYMIFNCTDHKTRLKHFHDWLDCYHTELDKRLVNFGLKADYVYPRDQLDVDMKRYAKLIFGQSIILANVITMKSDDASKIKEAMKTMNLHEDSQLFSMSDFNQDHMLLFQTRIQDLIDSYLQFELL